jgi:hypothetical protein
VFLLPLNFFDRWLRLLELLEVAGQGFEVGGGDRAKIAL